MATEVTGLPVRDPDVANASRLALVRLSSGRLALENEEQTSVEKDKISVVTLALVAPVGVPLGPQVPSTAVGTAEASGQAIVRVTARL